eukprot:CAMPEP_0197628882 /NCGR_PEP_ID=MMETSP1338-20131121/6984_1 /TAXON_ID=43686 ORGANISM="Pelagodinium beii, Strain RCC1491" /NCGR_SAMPLE_ID=MMETSP1338 /ASSEMBLY_ACC=CAM_ASM_000754 /LENGTH=1353 /DNA_ID=CAMNT_0043199883 /DNA_START=72 /DNA_END=4133 /DNA_ORIENTATION=+
MNQMKLLVVALLHNLLCQVDAWKIAANRTIAVDQKEKLPEYKEEERVPIRVPGNGYCWDRNHQESQARRFVETTCSGVRILCNRDCHCVAYACQESGPGAVMYTSEGCEMDCGQVDWILNSSLIVQAGHDQLNPAFADGQCWKFVQQDKKDEAKARLEEFNKCLPPLEVAFANGVVGATLDPDACPRDSNGKVKHDDFCGYVAVNGWDCTQLHAVCHNRNMTLMPSCTPKPCPVKAINGAAGTCPVGPDVQNGTACSWQATPTYTCEPEGSQTCLYGNWTDLPICIPRCPVPTVDGASVSPECKGENGAKKWAPSGSNCTWTPLENWTCSHNVTQCDTGNFDSIVQCWPMCLVPSILGTNPPNCTAGSMVAHSTICKWTTIDEDYTCTGVGNNPCTLGSFPDMACLAKCTVPNLAGEAKVTGQGCTFDKKVADSTECEWTEENDFYCQHAGSRTCRDGEFDKTPECERRCPVDTVVGANVKSVSGDTCSYTSSGSRPVAPGTVCQWEANPSHTCNFTEPKTCSHGGFSGSPPACDLKCAAPRIPEASLPAGVSVGDPVESGATLIWTTTDKDNWYCKNVDTPLVCRNGIWAVLPTCYKKCTVPTSELHGGATTNCTKAKVAPDHTGICAWTKKTGPDPGWTCDNMHNTKCTTNDGLFDHTPHCHSNCFVPTYAHTITTCPAIQKHSLSCTWQPKDPEQYTCSTNSITCNNGNFPSQPHCDRRCSVNSGSRVYSQAGQYEGLKNNCPNGVNHGQTCDFFADTLYSCDNIGSRTCDQGEFDNSNPISCTKKCVLPTGSQFEVDPQSSSRCKSGAVRVGESCSWQGKAGYSYCTNKVLTCQANGNFGKNGADATPICYHDCSVPNAGVGISGSTNCHTSTVAHNTACTWQQQSEYSCPSLQTTCNNGNLPAPPTCTQISCAIPTVTGARLDCAALTDGRVPHGASCTWKNVDPYRCASLPSVQCSNTHLSGGHASGCAIPVATTSGAAYSTGTCLPSGTYELNECCPTGYSIITSLDDCKAAYDQLQPKATGKAAQWGGNAPRTSRPTGCYLYTGNGNTHYNPTNVVGKTMAGDDMVICKQAAEPEAKVQVCEDNKTQCACPCPDDNPRGRSQCSCAQCPYYLEHLDIVYPGPNWPLRPCGTAPAGGPANITPVPGSTDWINKYYLNDSMPHCTEYEPCCAECCEGGKQCLKNSEGHILTNLEGHEIPPACVVDVTLIHAGLADGSITPDLLGGPDSVPLPLPINYNGRVGEEHKPMNVHRGDFAGHPAEWAPNNGDPNVPNGGWYWEDVGGTADEHNPHDSTNKFYRGDSPLSEEKPWWFHPSNHKVNVDTLSAHRDYTPATAAKAASFSQMMFR